MSYQLDDTPAGFQFRTYKLAEWDWREQEKTQAQEMGCAIVALEPGFGCPGFVQGPEPWDETARI